MAKPTAEKIGGELGDVRAAINIERLNAYLEAHVPEIAAPVTVKQFKVCNPGRFTCGFGLRPCWFQFGQVRLGVPPARNYLTFGRLVKSDLLPDGFCVRRPLHLSGLRYLFFTYYRGRKSVLRKKPAGQLLSSTAHQVEREYRVLNALHNHNVKPHTPPEKRVPVPQPYILCEDTAVIGTPFYIMEFLDGRIFTDVYMPQLNPKDRREWCVDLALNRRPLS
jgi:hypothetical protein